MAGLSKRLDKLEEKMTFETAEGKKIFVKDDMIREVIISPFHAGKTDCKDILFYLDDPDNSRREYTVLNDCANEIFTRLERMQTYGVI
jgi:hypothetical protein